MKNGRTPFNPADFADFRRSIGTEPTIPMDRNSDLTLEQALRLAISHIEHMAAWITAQNAGYSFESLGEDMPGIRAVVGSIDQSNRTVKD